MAFGGDLVKRRLVTEWMDAPDLEAGRLRLALRGLERINRFSRTAAAFWPGIQALLQHSGRSDLKILDIATGAGDIPIALAARARRAGYNLFIEGCDINEESLAHARAAATRQGLSVGADAAVRFFQLDVLHDPLPWADVVLCSLFLHHLSDADATGVLARMAGAAKQLLMASDLRRSRAGWALAAAGARVLTRSPVVHNDARRSVEAAFTIEEARELARMAGLFDARIKPIFPQRFLLVHWRQDIDSAIRNTRFKWSGL